MRYGESWRYLAVFLLLGSGSAAQDLQPPDEKPYTIGKIHLVKHSIFDEEEASSFLHKAANGLHVLTRDRVIRREFLFETGDSYDPALIEETERNLRDLRYLSEAEIRVEFKENQTVDVYVDTRDKFSLTVGSSGGFSGGEGKLGATIGESNLLGLGLRLKAKYVYRKENQKVRFSFSEPRLFSSRHHLSAAVSLADNSHRYRISLSRPFYSLDTRWSWGGSALLEESSLAYFDKGDTVNLMPTELSASRIFLMRAWGDRKLQFKFGPEVFFEAPGFFPPDPEDVDPGFELEVPTDRHILGIQLRPTLDWFPRYIERKELDAIDYVEDIALGVSVGVGIGVSYWDMKGGHGPRFPMSVHLTGAFEPWEQHLGTVQFAAKIRNGENRVEFWKLYSAFHYYYSGLPFQTLAMSIAYDAGEDLVDFPVQYTLGENSGLRGYEARYFDGDRRLRINLEDRIFTPLEVFTFRLGLVAFFDAGVAWDYSEGFDLGDLKTSAGVGIRIGSARFFQDSVLRFDLAFPFEEEGAESISVSLTSDQAFSLFRNPDNLSFD